MDISVSFPAEGRIRLQSRFLFGDPTADHCRQFVERLLDADEVSGITIRGNGYLFGSNMAEIRYCPRSYTRKEAIAAIYKRLAGDRSVNGNGHSDGNGHTNGNGHANGHSHHHHTNGNGHANGHAPATVAETDPRGTTTGETGRRRGPGFRMPKLPKGTLRAIRCRPVAVAGDSEWAVLHESPGPHPVPERPAASPPGGLPGHRARADEHPGHRQLQDQRPHRLGPDPLRHQAAQAGRSSSRSSSRRSPQAEAPGGRTRPISICRSARPRSPLAAAAQFLAPPLLPVAARAVPLHLDPDLPKMPARSSSKSDGWGSTCSTRSWSSAAWARCTIFPGARALLVPGLRPGPGQEDAGRLQAAAARTPSASSRGSSGSTATASRSRSRWTSSRPAT